MLSRIFRIIPIAVLCGALLTNARVRADEGINTNVINKPLWEAGLFTGAASIPHYRGSDENEFYVLPIPYFIYRGEVIQTGRDGLNGIFFDSDYVETALSFGGNPPVNDDNDARTGMPELDFLVEGGPAVKWYPFGYDQTHRFYLRTSVRAATSVGDDLGLKYQGLRGDVKVIYRKQDFLNIKELAAGVTAGVDFSNSEYNRYFYEVDEEYATPERPAYSPGGGYAGFNLSTYLFKKINESFSVGVFGRWDNIDGTAYENSPLVRTHNTASVGAALIWRIKQSDRIVHIDP